MASSPRSGRWRTFCRRQSDPSLFGRPVTIGRLRALILNGAIDDAVVALSAIHFWASSSLSMPSLLGVQKVNDSAQETLFLCRKPNVRPESTRCAPNSRFARRMCPEFCGNAGSAADSKTSCGSEHFQRSGGLNSRTHNKPASLKRVSMIVQRIPDAIQMNSKCCRDIGGLFSE